MEYHDPELERLAEANASLRRQLELMQAPILTLPEAMERTRKKSARAFGDWRRKYGVPVLQEGPEPRFAREDIERGLRKEVEAGRKRWAKNRRTGTRRGRPRKAPAQDEN